MSSVITPPPGRSTRESENPILDEIIQAALSGNAGYFDELIAELERRLAPLEASGAPLSELAYEAQQILLEFREPLAAILADAHIAAQLSGAGAVARLVPASVLSAGHGGPPSRPPWLTTSGGEDWGWDGMGVWLPLIDAAVSDLKERRLYTRDDFDQLSYSARQNAFTVAGLRTMEALGRVREAVVRAAQEGTGLGRFHEDLAEGLETSTIGPGLMENVFRTNLAKANSRGMDEILEHPVVDPGFPFEAVLVIPDVRLTDLCRIVSESGIDGSNIFLRADPTYQHFKSPRHWQCRCTRQPLTLQAAADRGLEYAKKWLETGGQPMPPAFVPYPKVELPEGWTPP